MWIARAMHEVRAARRTWFGTFTLRPEAHYEMQCRAIAKASARSVASKDLSDEELLVLQTNEVASEMTKYLKRVRKSVALSGALRYLMVRENHKSGLPHYHMLLHESADIPIKHKVLVDCWPHGFTKFKLVGEDERAAFYVVKYLGKADGGRVRASIRYGRRGGAPDTSSDIANEESVWSDYLQACKALQVSSRENSHKDGASAARASRLFAQQIDEQAPSSGNLKELLELCTAGDD